MLINNVYGAPIISQEAGRRAFWSVNGPRIVQVGYEDEENPKVMEAYEQLGSLVQEILVPHVHFLIHCLSIRQLKYESIFISW